MNLVRWLLTVSCFSLAVVIGCSNDPSSNLEVSGEGGSINIQLVADAASDFRDVARTAEVKISGEGMPTLTMPLTVTATGISGTITGIQAGTDRKFEVFVYDVANKVCYYGGAFGNVSAGATASIALTLYRSTGEGNATISGSIESGNTPPVVSLTSPANNSQYSVGEVIPLAATASDNDGSVSNVSFYNGGTLIGTDASAPFTYNFTSAAAGTLSLTAVATDNSGASTRSSVIAVTVRVVNSVSYQINAGGSAVAPYTADAYFSGGTATSITSAVTTTGVVNPAPPAVYQAERYGNVTYTIPNLTAGASYKVRLHFAELYWTASGKRSFNVSINGSQVMSNFDIYVAAGGAKKAIVKEFTATATTSGQILIALAKVTDNAQICGIEILPNQIQTFTITYNLDGGTNNAGNPATYTASSPAITLAYPNKAGYAFGGWYANSGLTGTPVTSIPSGSTGDKVFWAKFTTETYQLTLTATTGGAISAPVSPATVSNGVATTIAAAPNTGYTFVNWTVSTGTATFASATSASTTVTLTSGNATIVANFMLRVYQLTLNAGSGGTIASPASPATVSHGAATAISAAPGVGYLFANWAVTAGTATIAAPTSASTTVTLNSGNATVVATFKGVTFERTLTVNDVAVDIKPLSAGGYIITGNRNHIKIDLSGALVSTNLYNDNIIANSIDLTSDGGYVVAGHGSGAPDDIIMKKFYANGNMAWSQSYGGTSSENGYFATQTTDGGFITGGSTCSFGTLNWEYYLVKTDASGVTTWTNYFDGGGVDFLQDCRQTSDGGYILVGGANMGADIWVVKTTSTGTLSWNNYYTSIVGTSGQGAMLYSVRSTTGGYIIAGSSRSGGGLLFKISTTGSLVWSKAFSDAGSIRAVRETPDGGYVFVSYTVSLGAGQTDVYMVKTNSTGDLSWQRTFGTAAGDESGNSIETTQDGGYVIAAQKGSQCYVIKTDGNGQVSP